MKLEDIIGNAIRKYRKQRNYSQEKLALESNLDRSFLSEIERGVKKPTVHTIFAICKTLEIKPSALIHEIETEYEKIEEPNDKQKSPIE